MIGTVTLNREEIKKFIIDYFSDYKDIKVYFKETSIKTGTGIVVSHFHETKNGSKVKLSEELEIDDVKEIFTNVFSDEGYVATNVYLDTRHTGDGYGECVELQSIKVQLHKKEKEKQKAL